MVTTTNITNVFAGLSTDIKPTEDVANGSLLIEMDTGTQYIFDAENKTWEEWDSGSGGGGGGGGTADTKLKKAIAVSYETGKYKHGQTIPAGTQFEELFRSMLTSTSYPTLTSPSATLTYSTNETYKVGQSVPATSARINFDRGSINPQYTAESAFRAGAATGYSIRLNNANITFSESNTTGQFAVPTFTRTSAGAVTLVGTVNHEAGPQPKDSDGNNYETALPAGSVTATKTIQFFVPFYHGVNSTGTIADVSEIESLTEEVTAKANKEYRYTTNYEYLIFAYSTAHGNLSSILDQNGFETLSGWDKTVVGNYNVYITKLPTTDTDAKYTFKF